MVLIWSQRSLLGSAIFSHIEPEPILYFTSAATQVFSLVKVSCTVIVNSPTLHCLSVLHSVELHMCIEQGLSPAHHKTPHNIMSAKCSMSLFIHVIYLRYEHLFHFSSVWVSCILLSSMVCSVFTALLWVSSQSHSSSHCKCNNGTRYQQILSIKWLRSGSGAGAQKTWLDIPNKNQTFTIFCFSTLTPISVVTVHCAPTQPSSSHCYYFFCS